MKTLTTEKQAFNLSAPIVAPTFSKKQEDKVRKAAKASEELSLTVTDLGINGTKAFNAEIRDTFAYSLFYAMNEADKAAKAAKPRTNARKAAMEDKKRLSKELTLAIRTFRFCRELETLIDEFCGMYMHGDIIEQAKCACKIMGGLGLNLEGANNIAKTALFLTRAVSVKKATNNQAMKGIIAKVSPTETRKILVNLILSIAYNDGTKPAQPALVGPKAIEA